jgi:hypothetical protein
MGPLVTGESGAIFGIHVDASRNRVYAAVNDGAGVGGVAYFDNDSLALEKITRIPGAKEMNDIYIGDDDRVYATEYLAGSIYTCDKDLDACKLVVTSTLLQPNSSAGVNGLV